MEMSICVPARPFSKNPISCKMKKIKLNVHTKKSVFGSNLTMLFYAEPITV